MKRHEIRLFVMHGCQLCPKMEQVFRKMNRNGAIDTLEIIDIGEHPELAEQYHIRSVPYYFIDGVGFSGLRSVHDIEQILQQDDSTHWQQLIVEALSAGQLEVAEQLVREQAKARAAMMQLLADDRTTLLVRIGLAAIIETLAGEGLLDDCEPQFIELANTGNQTIAQDAIYYLSLLGSNNSFQALLDISRDNNHPLHQQAVELLQEISDEQAMH